MTDFVDVVDHNPITFVKDVCEKLAEGYVVHNTIAGAPFFGNMYYSVRLFKTDRQFIADIPSDTDRAEHYEALGLLQALESFVAAGYEFHLHGVHFFDDRSFKSVQMRLASQVEEKPVKKAPAKKALKAED